MSQCVTQDGLLCLQGMNSGVIIFTEEVACHSSSLEALVKCRVTGPEGKGGNGPNDECLSP